MKNKKKIHGLLRYGLLGFFVVMGITGCGRETMKEPVTVTIWHVYGGQAESPLNDMIAQFNETVEMCIRDSKFTIPILNLSNSIGLKQNLEIMLLH